MKNTSNLVYPEIWPILFVPNSIPENSQTERMLSKMAMLSRSALPVIAKGSADFALSHCYIVKRNFRGRTYVCEQNVEESTPSLPEEPSAVIQPEESEVVPEETGRFNLYRLFLVDMQSIQFDDLCAKQMIDDSNQSPYSDLVRESDNVYRRLSGKEEMHDIPSIERGNVSALSFEDDFFRLEDEMNHQYLEDDVNDTLAEANAENADEQVTFVNQENTKEFFDRILAIDSNAVLTEEEKRRISIVREEKKEEKKEIKRHTWFNFMPAKEKPEGMFGTYSPDQIYSSLVFDLLSRNMDEIYKYEKDDLFLNEVSLFFKGFIQ